MSRNEFTADTSKQQVWASRRFYAQNHSMHLQRLVEYFVVVADENIDSLLLLLL